MGVAIWLIDRWRVSCGVFLIGSITGARRHDCGSQTRCVTPSRRGRLIDDPSGKAVPTSR
jgi:hypothetical protein